MERYNENDIIETKEEILKLYPFLSKEQALEISSAMLQYWDNELDNL